MVIGALELITWLVNAAKDRRASTELVGVRGGPLPPVAITLSCLLVFGWMYESLPGVDGRVDRGRHRCTRGARSARGPSPVGRVGRRVDPLQHARLRGPAEVPGVQRTRHDDGRASAPSERLRSRAVGEQQRQRRVRHHDGADAAAALDRRLHRVDGGPVLRGVGHHAVPLPHRGGDVGAVVEPGAPAALRQQRRARSACSTCTTSACGT